MGSSGLHKRSPERWRTPLHFPTQNSQMMNSQQQLQFPISEDAAYFLPAGQYYPQYVSLAQQFPVVYPDWSSAYGVPYYPTQAQYQSSGPTTPIILSPALQQQAPPPQYALPQQRRRECQQTVVAVQTDDESTPPTATVVIPPAAASTPPPPSKVPELVVPSKLTTEPNLSQGLQLASPLSTVPVGQDSDFGVSASPPPPLTDLPPADIPALEPKMGESMDVPLLPEAVPQAEKEPVEAPLEPECLVQRRHPAEQGREGVEALNEEGARPHG
ncbi:uncharacterized protein LOC143497137 [Brachyhypopomus gauderio]|uniref:uncharacterized protein LOC143497137 n=1 Tax=Brachyhypopomus gauderio TaxID=698409 RepID=UPI004042AB21